MEILEKMCSGITWKGAHAARNAGIMEKPGFSDAESLPRRTPLQVLSSLILMMF
jgi:hypothetical protein